MIPQSNYRPTVLGQNRPTFTIDPAVRCWNHDPCRALTRVPVHIAMSVALPLINEMPIRLNSTKFVPPFSTKVAGVPGTLPFISKTDRLRAIRSRSRRRWVPHFVRCAVQRCRQDPVAIRGASAMVEGIPVHVRMRITRSMSCCVERNHGRETVARSRTARPGCKASRRQTLRQSRRKRRHRS